MRTDAASEPDRVASDGDRPRATRATAVRFFTAGVLALGAWALFEFVDPEYYDASTAADYLSVWVLSAALVGSGVALVRLWRRPPVGRGSWLLLLAGAGAVAEGMGNLLEDVFDVEAAV